MIPEEAMRPAPEPPELAAVPDEAVETPDELQELGEDWPVPELPQGAQVCLPVGALTVMAVVVGQAFHHGRWLYEVTPVAGHGRRWVSLDELDAVPIT